MSSRPTYYYTWTPARPPVARVSTSRTELTHLALAFGVLTVDLVLVLGGGGLLFGSRQGLLPLFTPWIVLVSAAAVLSGFFFD